MARTKSLWMHAAICLGGIVVLLGSTASSQDTLRSWLGIGAIVCGVVFLVRVGGVVYAWCAVGRAARRASRGRCVECGYDRTGLRPNAPCPECGIKAGPAER